MKKHYVTHVEDTDKSISVAGPVLDYKQWYTDYIKLMEEQAQRKYGLYTPEDAFPTLPGDVTRWSFKGLTNEMMAKNPRLEDVDGKGRFLTFKNFAWGEMSGCGGYDYDFTKKSIFNYSGANANAKISSDTLYIEKVDNSKVNVVIRLAQFKCRLKITGVSDSINSGEIRLLRMYSSKDFDNRITINTDGIYDVDIPNQKDGLIYIFAVSSQGTIENPLTLTTPITIEQLPYYPGFIISDGVDDYAVTEKNLDFEDTYTVYTAFIPFQEVPARNMVLCGKNNTKDFYMSYSSLNGINFYSSAKYITALLNNGFNLIACKRTMDKMVVENLLTHTSVEIDANTLVQNPGLYYLWRSLNITAYAKAAIAGQVICNGHFTTDEEDTKVLNWYKKEYPWLFFDQAWTVTGKTNEDTDRATIANITGNGNNLVLSNFGFAGNSGYGEYAQNFNGYGFGNLKTITYTRTAASMKLDVPAGSSENIYSNVNGEAPIGFVYNFNLKITGLKTGNLLSISQGATLDNIIADINQDGVYNIKATVDDSWNQRRIYIWIRNSNGPETTLSIEQIPDHEGYLVTDGVDDKVYSSAFTLGKKFTVVGEWIFIKTEQVYTLAGITKSASFILYNYNAGTNAYILSLRGTPINGEHAVKAVRSPNIVYKSNWDERKLNTEQNGKDEGKPLAIGWNTNQFTRMAFKNIAIYGKELSKEDAIKAYIYLQTLKAK